jgi:RimJ/RimL family protein N-acetyltransferase
MAWLMTHSIGEFTGAAGEYLLADPVGNTVPLTVLEVLRERGLSAYADQPPLFGWHESAGQADGAFLHTPPLPVLVAGLPAAASAGLATLLAGRSITGANVPEHHQADFAATWSSVTGGSSTVLKRMRLFRLGDLTPPDPFPPGTGRVASEEDYDFLVQWASEFGDETGESSQEPARTVTDRLSYDGITLWEDGGRPVASASLTRCVAGVCRVSSVYTPAEFRRRGYGAAVTTAVTRQALDLGARAVVLYTDLANPTSNALYQRLGYLAVSDRVSLGLSDDPVTAERADSSGWS